MPLKAVVDTIDQVPEAFRAEYVQKDGKFVLAIEGDPVGYVPGAQVADLNGKLAEFRDNNRKLVSALGADSLDKALARAALVTGIDSAKLERLKAIDPDEYEALKQKVDKLKAKGADDPDQLEAKIGTAIANALKPVQDQLKAEQTLRTEAQQRADKALLRQTIGDAFTKAGGKPGALDFILGKADGTFRVVENEVKAAENKFSAQKPTEPLGIEEWLAGAMKEYDFAFNPSNGGGAHGSERGGRPTPLSTGVFKLPGGKELKAEGIKVLA